MQLVCVSRGSLKTGLEFAGSLARKLDSTLLTREELLDRADDEGIAVGRLETAVRKRRPLDERLVRDKEHFQAFITMVICERALEADVVYAGRSGHLLLPGVTHILRVQVVADMETRIAAVMQGQRLGRAAAKRYIEQVEEDRGRWARLLYDIDWHFTGIYDLVVNLEQVGVESATTALCSYAQLPEFRETPASHKALENLYLAARARVALARDRHTHSASLKVRANEGVLSVTYSPRDAALAAAIPSALDQLTAIRDLRCSMATTNILLVQECFDASSPGFAALARIAERWGAAVELLRVVPQVEPEEGAGALGSGALEPGQAEEGTGEDGAEGEDGPPRPAGCDDAGLWAVHDALRQRAIAGGMHTASATPRRIALAIDRTVPYSLVVVGEIFTRQGHAVSRRMTRELAARLSDALRVPVVRTEELSTQYLVGPLQLARLGVFGLTTILLYALVFSHQREVLQFLAPQAGVGKIVAAGSVLLFVPMLAYVYGNLAKSLLELLKVE